MADPNPRTWFITGATSGLGRALAEAVLARGERTVATARHTDDLRDLVAAQPDAVRAIALDLTADDADVRRAVEEAEAAFDGFDVLVNNAGHGLSGAIEEVSDAEVREVFDANVFGLLKVTRAALPGLRARRSGHVVNIGSVGGLAANAGSGIYGATKFAVEGISEALRAELAPLGIHVTVVEPGPFRTGFAGRSMHESAIVIPDYADTAGRWRRRLREQIDGKQPGDPYRAAQAIIAAVDAPELPLHLVLGSGAMDRVRAKLASFVEELDRWEAVSRSTEFKNGEERAE